MRHYFRRLTGLSATVLCAVTLSACGSDSDDGDDSDSGQTTSSRPDVDLDSIQADPALAAKVPAQYADNGTLVVGSDTEYPPNEFIDEDGKTIVGMDVDLAVAIGKKLDLDVEFQTAPFTGILPALGSKYDLGISSFTVDADREQVVDFVHYFEAGTAWVTKTGADYDVDSPCGTSVAVQTGTVQDTNDLPERQKACSDAGDPDIDIQSFESQADATNAVVTGKADAMLADFPVIIDAVSKTDGQLEQVGEMYDAAPYGIAVPKDARPLAEALLGGLQALIDDGTYTDILAKWGAEDGAITDPTITPPASG